MTDIPIHKRHRGLTFALACLTIVIGLSFWETEEQQATSDKPTASSKDPDKNLKAADSDQLAKVESQPLVETSHTVTPGSTAYSTLSAAGVNPAIIQKLVLAAKEHANFAAVQPNSVFVLSWATNNDGSKNLKELQYAINPTKILIIEQSEGDPEWHPRIKNKDIRVAIETYQGVVKGSLWSSASDAGMNGSIISRLGEIFAWQIDFSREVRNGDRWRLTIERKYVDDKPYKWGNIIGAEYINAGEIFTALRYVGLNGKAAYYAPNGDSLRRIFLKSPVRFSRITSKFSKRRFHPILKINRPHRGVDYGAPRGTPVRSVGDGKVTYATYKKTSGKVIKIRHNATYSTSYHHLSRFQKGMRKGKSISQGDIIGYVGSTGLATGAHLHFAFYENGRYVDPLGMKFPSADPVPKSELADFLVYSQKAVSTLPTWASQLTAAGSGLKKISQRSKEIQGSISPQ